MLFNPLTGQIINSNPDGHNQFFNPDSGIKSKANNLQRHLLSSQIEGREVLDYWDKDPEFGAVAMRARHLVNPGAASEKKLRLLVSTIRSKRKAKKAEQNLFGRN